MHRLIFLMTQNVLLLLGKGIVELTDNQRRILAHWTQQIQYTAAPQPWVGLTEIPAIFPEIEPEEALRLFARELNGLSEAVNDVLQTKKKARLPLYSWTGNGYGLSDAFSFEAMEARFLVQVPYFSTKTARNSHVFINGKRVELNIQALRILAALGAVEEGRRVWVPQKTVLSQMAGFELNTEEQGLTAKKSFDLWLRILSELFYGTESPPSVLKMRAGNSGAEYQLSPDIQVEHLG